MIKNVLKLILLPLGLLYGIIMEIRSLLYNTGLFKQYKFPVPVISIGNISAGGTGKTPFTLMLLDLLKEKYKNIAVVSRGYGRKSRGAILVSDGRQILQKVEAAGDESYMIALKHPDVMVMVAEKRREGIEILLNKYPVDCIILDDAYQHRSVFRDLNIVLINAAEAWRFNFPIPSGTLREFKWQIKRADLIVFTNYFKGKRLPRLNREIPSLRVNSELGQVMDKILNKVASINDFKEGNYAAFAGIAHPENFKISLEKSGISLSMFVQFADHYDFQDTDIYFLLKQAKEKGCKAVFCTEKDLVKVQNILNSADFAKDDYPPIYGVSLELVVDGQEILKKKLFGFMA